MIKQIKEHAVKPKVIIGGPGFSLFPEQIMNRIPEIDMGIFLEAEESFPEILEHLDNPGSVPGIFYRKDGKVLFSGRRNGPDLSLIPLPRRDMVDLGFYQGPDAMGVQSKRGCVFHCAYCTYQYLSGGKMRLFPPAKVVDEIEKLANEYHVDKIFFADSIFNVPLSHAESICREIIKRNIKIKWAAYFDMKHINEDFARLAVEAGCALFDFSPDGYADKVLSILHKDLTRKDIENCLDVCRKVPGFSFRLNFFLDPPGQDLLSFIRLGVFLIRTKLIFGNRMKGFGLTRIRIEPHTEIEQIALREGVIDKNTDLLAPVLYSNPSAAHIRFLYDSLRAIKNIVRPSAGK
jgi:radical SAM superfamily enzyme YgiQ (UPF0313 family)